MAITPNREQFVELSQAPDEGPVTMLNLLRFKDKAEGEEGSGRDAYNRYGDSVIKMVEAQGGKMLWIGRADQVLIGDTEADRWHAVALVQYPSRKAFIEMVTTPEYNDAHKHRESGLDSTVLIAMTQTGP